jgi:sulfur relay (sulfurtransferase) complex TusBCD TusD component (DsrE family)
MSEEGEGPAMPRTFTIFLASTPYGSENTHTALRIIGAALESGHSVNVFASGDGVHNFTAGQKAAGVPNAEAGFADLIRRGLRVDI